MSAETHIQLDYFEEKLPPETNNLQKITVLEHRQNKLRQGLFKRFGEHEKKFDEVNQLMKRIIELLAVEKK